METYRKMVVKERTRSINILKEVKAFSDKLDKKGEGE